MSPFKTTCSLFLCESVLVCKSPFAYDQIIDGKRTKFKINPKSKSILFLQRNLCKIFYLQAIKNAATVTYQMT